MCKIQNDILGFCGVTIFKPKVFILTPVFPMYSDAAEILSSFFNSLIFVKTLVWHVPGGMSLPKVPALFKGKRWNKKNFRHSGKERDVQNVYSFIASLPIIITLTHISFTKGSLIGSLIRSNTNRSEIHASRTVGKSWNKWKISRQHFHFKVGTMVE